MKKTFLMNTLIVKFICKLLILASIFFISCSNLVTLSDNGERPKFHIDEDDGEVGRFFFSLGRLELVNKYGTQVAFLDDFTALISRLDRIWAIQYTITALNWRPHDYWQGFVIYFLDYNGNVLGVERFGCNICCKVKGRIVINSGRIKNYVRIGKIHDIRIEPMDHLWMSCAYGHMCNGDCVEQELERAVEKRRKKEKKLRGI